MSNMLISIVIVGTGSVITDVLNAAKQQEKQHLNDLHLKGKVSQN